MSCKSAENVARQSWTIGGSWSEIVVRFDHAGTVQYPYMYHCNILEHEDRGMMGQFTVV